MYRSTPRDTGNRAYHGLARSTVNSVEDGHNMQESAGEFMQGETRKGIERPQNYGFTSVILPRDQQQGSGAGDNRGEAAESFMMFAGGNRSHPVALVTDDRRHRPYGLQPGESFQYDDQGQGTYVHRNGAMMMATKGEGASLRHVNKAKQPRKKAKQQAAAYEHKGTVNTEVVCFADRIDFKIGGAVRMRITGDKIVMVGKVFAGGDAIDEVPTQKLDITNGTPSKQVYSKS